MDIALRVGKLQDSSYIQSFLMNINLVMVASQSYLRKHKEILHKKDLIDHNLLLLRRNNSIMKLSNLNTEGYKISTSTNFPMLYQMVKSEHGIGVIPDFYCQKDIENAKVIKLFPNWKIMTTKLHIVYPSKKNLSKRVRLFIDFLKSEIQNKKA